MRAVAPEWGTAEVASVLTANDIDDEKTYAAFAIKPNTDIIYSLNPSEDYEINPNTIDGWKMIFFDEEGETMGDADYFTTLNQIKAYIIEEYNNSIVTKKLTQDELEQVFQKANGQKTIRLTS